MASKNWGLQVPTKTTPLTPLATPFALLASSISDALTAVLSGSAKRGTTAQRDAFYGVPTTSAAQLALQGATWFNTQSGLEATYYASYSASTTHGASSAGWSPHGAVYNLGPASGMTAASGSLYVVRRGGWAHLHGYVRRTAGQFPTGDTTLISSIPDGFQPREYIRWAGQYYSNFTAQLGMASALVLTQSGAATTADTVYIDSPPYEVKL